MQSADFILFMGHGYKRKKQHAVQNYIHHQVNASVQGRDRQHVVIFNRTTTETT